MTFSISPFHINVLNSLVVSVLSLIGLGSGAVCHYGHMFVLYKILLGCLGMVFYQLLIALFVSANKFHQHVTAGVWRHMAHLFAKCHLATVLEWFLAQFQRFIAKSKYPSDTELRWFTQLYWALFVVIYGSHGMLIILIQWLLMLRLSFARLS